MNARHTRRELLKLVGAGTAWIALLSVLGCEPLERERRTRRSPAVRSRDVRIFSRPDFNPPGVDVATAAGDTAPGYIFVAPKKGGGQYGPMILDDHGDLVWFRPLQNKDEYAMDFKVQYYRGEPVLSWAEGMVLAAGYGLVEYVILDGSYQEITRVRAGNDYWGDHHEFLITPQNTALLTIYASTPADLSSVGGPKDGEVLEGVAQEIDIETGEVLFEWHSLDHVDLDESYKSPENPGKPFEYFHINSIDIDHDGNLLVSAKGTFTVYKIDRGTGEVIWRLGGKKSDFDMGPGTRTDYQHDARRQPDGTITIFDNGAAPKVHNQSRGIVLDLDEDKMIAVLVREYFHPDKLLANTQGNMQVLANGNVFIGWGSQPFFSEFNGDGELLFEASFTGEAESYRAFRFPWSGQPSDQPAAVAERGPGDEVTVYASWNGATEVATWQALAGPGPDRLKPVTSVPRHGFETAIAVNTAELYVGARAKHRSGRVLGTTKAVKL
ncbi:MAG TPA: arylsulfotransferase family protein [Rubrobacter sp.]|nr:arylsulfotransferase family protein [Rubrobacter sp.]